MPVFDLFSKRQKRLNNKEPDVYQYETLPDTLRVQFVHIWRDQIGDISVMDRYSDGFGNVRAAYKVLVELLRKEYGVFNLLGKGGSNESYMFEVFNFFLNEKRIDRALDVIELCARWIAIETSEPSYRHKHTAAEDAKDAIDEMNQRFREAGVGYEISDGSVIKIDEQLIHVEAVKPALLLLSKKEFKGAQVEFLSAHEHYRGGKHKEALTDCLKAFESVMKAICDKRKWSYAPTDTAKKLIDIMFANGLVPPFWQTEFASLRALLESSVPTGRNKLGGHGQGTNPTTVPDYLTAYMLHMTASTIVFLAKADEALP